MKLTQAVHQGFILSRQQIQREGRLYLCYWLKTDKGVIKATIENESLVLFLKQAVLNRACDILHSESISFNYKQSHLLHFDQSPVSAMYFDSLPDFYRAKACLKERAITLYEDDIRHADRYLMERFIKGGAWVKGDESKHSGYLKLSNAQFKPAPSYTPNLTACSFDIECSGEGVLFSIGLIQGEHREVIMVGSNEDVIDEGLITWVKDELELLTVFEARVQVLNPDILIGWNVIEFDCVVLSERAEAHGLSLKLGRDNSKLYITKGHFVRVSIPGRTVLCGIDMMKNATYHYESFRLDFIAEKVLGKRKLIESEDRLAEIMALYKEDKLSLAKYNIEDCQLVLDIFQKLSLIDFSIARTRLTGLELERMGGSVAAFTNLYLPLLHRSGYIAPNLGEHGLTFESPGGYVMDSQPGMHKNVLVLDFKSLYPSIIRTFLIDPLGLIEGLKSPLDSLEGYNKGQFSREHHHLPKLVETLSHARELAKRENDMMLSQAIKIIMNSLYGVLGSKGCRFYDPRLSSSITMRGHQIMQKTKAWIETEGHSVIYGDTDSTFVKVCDTFSQGDCQRIGKTLVEKINRQWQVYLKDTFAIESHLELEFETIYSPFFMPTIRGQETGSKKRYVGQVWHDGKYDLIFKGLETVRSDWTDIAKQYQKAVIRALFDGQDTQSLTQAYIDKINNGEADNLLIYHKRLGKPLEQYTKNIPPHVRAAKEYAKTHSGVRKGSRIPYYISKNGPTYYEGEVILPDYIHYIEKQILPIFLMLPDVNLSSVSISNQHTLF